MVAAIEIPARCACPVCGSGESRVVDSRPRGLNEIRRRRGCPGCDHRWTTYEIPAERLAALEAAERLVGRIRETVIDAG